MSVFSFASRRALVAFAAAAPPATAYGYYQIAIAEPGGEGDSAPPDASPPRSGFVRALKLWTELGPVIAHYRLVEAVHAYAPNALLSAEARSAHWRDLDARYAHKVLASLQGLRGFYIKVGQLLAQRNDMLSSAYIEKLRNLEDNVPPLMDGDAARDVVCRALNLKTVDEVFESFGDEPIGSASIGQVHKAVLKRTHRPVAIKIQSPGAEELFRSDLKTARTFCKVFVPEQVILFDEIEKQFANEFDYRVEAANVNQMHANMTPQFGRRIVVPRAHTDLCTREVLTMDFLDGVKLVDGVRAVATVWCERNGTTLDAYERDLRERYLRDGLPDVYRGPSAFAIDLYVRAIELGDAVVNTPRLLFNWTVGWLLPRSWLFKYHKSFIPLNTARIMDTLLQAHGKQVLIDGFLNGDPHPGNFLLLKDGRLGMLDMGQIKQLTREERIFVARLYKALADEDREALKQLSIEGGYKSKYMNAEVMFKITQVGFDQDGRHVTEGLNLQQYVDKLYKMDPWEKGLDAVVMPMRVSLLLRGVGLMLNHPVSVAAAWKPFAEQALREAKYSN
ncbi:hypothetical protein HDU82_006230 [Entophlyctis luteolus]|nr:hypothetical protein HDU82_006230 [Entophlyctis luteolus]